MARLDDDEYIDLQYKAFGINENDLLEAIQVNTIMLSIEKYVFNDSQLYVSIVSLFIYFSLLFFLLINGKKKTLSLFFVHVTLIKSTEDIGRKTNFTRYAG